MDKNYGVLIAYKFKGIVNGLLARCPAAGDILCLGETIFSISALPAALSLSFKATITSSTLHEVSSICSTRTKIGRPPIGWKTLFVTEPNLLPVPPAGTIAVVNILFCVWLGEDHSPGRCLQDAGYYNLDILADEFAGIFHNHHRTVICVGNPWLDSLPSLIINTFIISPGRTTGLRAFASSLILSTGTS